jgi:hypothetical protein
MSKRNKEKAPRHVRLYHWFLKGDAWRSLSPNARAIYVEIVERYNGTNNGRISFSIREGADLLHIGKNAAAKALLVLQERGFIVAAKRGGFNLRYKDQMATEWRLTEFSSDIDANFATKDFMKWTGPEKQNTVPVRGQTAPVRGQSGTCERTVVAEMSRTGTCERTVEAQKSPVLSPDGYAYSIPGGRPSKRDAGLPTAVAEPEPEPDPVYPGSEPTEPEPTEPEPAAVLAADDLRRNNKTAEERLDGNAEPVPSIAPSEVATDRTRPILVGDLDIPADLSIPEFLLRTGSTICAAASALRRRREAQQTKRRRP